MRPSTGLSQLLSAWTLLSLTSLVLAFEPRPYEEGHNWPGAPRSLGPGRPSRPTTVPPTGSSAVLGCPSAGYPGGAPTATIDAGVVIGTQTTLPTATAAVNKYLGIPFAKNPPERFSPLESPGTFEQPINATAFGPACIQQFVYPLATQEFTKFVFNDPGGPIPSESESCLYANVYAPSSPAPADGRAVLFWIYGGALEFGNAGQPAYDGSAFAAYEDVIVVTTNYRTNVFGFASTPELPIDQRNLGFLDQRFALAWCQRNIAAFGGSPDKITIFGESAGGFSVDALLTSYTAADTPPFRGAIMESGQYSFRPNPLPDTAASWYNLSAQLGCPGNYDSNLTCLRAANASLIKSTIEHSMLTFNPTADNVTLFANTAQRRLDGNVAHVPSMGGSNSQEGRVFEISQFNASLSLGTLFQSNTALISAIEQAYNITDPDNANSYDQLSEIFTDLVFQCPQALWSNITAANGIPNWRYYYNASFFNEQPVASLGVFHSSEIPLVFGTYSKLNATTQEVALSNAMMGAWARFAKNPAGGPGWNPVGTGSAGDLLVGASSVALGGIYTDLVGDVQTGAFDLGVFGNRGDVQGSGVTVIDQSEVDYRCGVFRQLYEVVNGVTFP